MIKDDVKLGKGAVVFQPDLVNLYGCEIGDETKIGAFVEIRKGVVIGKRCKIQAFAFIPEGVTVEDGVFIGPHACFTNDLFPRAVNDDGSLQAATDWVADADAGQGRRVDRCQRDHPVRHHHRPLRAGGRRRRCYQRRSGFRDRRRQPGQGAGRRERQG